MIFIVLGLFGILGGIGSSLFGFGGGFIIVPLLYHVLGTHHPLSMHIAVATSTGTIVINSLNAMYKHRKNIIWNKVFPLVIYIAIGSVIGVYLTKFMNNTIIRWCFVAFIAYTIYNCVAGKNFINCSDVEIKPLNKYLNFVAGILIGIIATIIGIGGSVLTVPLMRKLGAKMKNAVAMANPLSFPVGLIGVIGFTILAYSSHINLGNEYIGFIYLPALATLIIGGFIGVPIGALLVDKVSDVLHAKIYIVLLILVLLAMAA
ncbi:MAG: sulfite exporter TauE/SafE family protein [Burkholderiales bacterium]|nr:sulfite exporter TauE/SafE family protein [Burkholderiales bacterium]